MSAYSQHAAVFLFLYVIMAAAIITTIAQLWQQRNRGQPLSSTTPLLHRGPTCSTRPWYLFWRRDQRYDLEQGSPVSSPPRYASNGYGATNIFAGFDGVQQAAYASPVLITNFSFSLSLGASSSSLLTSLEVLTSSEPVATHSFSHTYAHIRTLAYCSEGPVHLVRHRKNGKQYVIKQVPASSGLPHEAAILKKIQPHPNIIEIAATLDGHTAQRVTTDIVTPFAELGDLHNLIDHFNKRNEFVPRAFVLHFVSSMIDALAYIHDGSVCYDSRADTITSVAHRQPSIIHRDIKPLNIFLTASASTMPGLPQIKLADFGLACTPGNNKGVVGTPGYKAPEICKIDELYAAGIPYYLDNYGRIPDICSKAGDFYAFGVSLYQLIFFRDYDPKCNIDADILETLMEDDIEICDLLKACLAHDPENRPTASACHSLSADIKTELREWYASGGRLPDYMWPDPMSSDKAREERQANAGASRSSVYSSQYQVIGSRQLRRMARVSSFDLDAYLCQSSSYPSRERQAAVPAMGNGRASQFASQMS